MRRALVMGLLALTGCATTAEDKLRYELSTEIYWDAAKACEREFHSLHMNKLGIDGDLDLDVDAGQTHEIPRFARCYWDAIEKRVEQRRAAGLPMPEKFELHPDVGGAGD